MAGNAVRARRRVRNLRQPRRFLLLVHLRRAQAAGLTGASVFGRFLVLNHLRDCLGLSSLKDVFSLTLLTFYLFLNNSYRSCLERRGWRRDGAGDAFGFLAPSPLLNFRES